MLAKRISRHCWEQILARQWEVKAKRVKVVFFLRWSQVKTEEMSFQVTLEDWQGSSSPDGGGRSFHQPGTVNENVLERDFVPLCDGTARHRSLADLRLLEGCRFVIVSGSRRVLSLWLFYMQASVSWTGCELQPGDSAGSKRVYTNHVYGILITIWINTSFTTNTMVKLWLM